MIGRNLALATDARKHSADPGILPPPRVVAVDSELSPPSPDVIDASSTITSRCRMESQGPQSDSFTLRTVELSTLR